MADEIVGFRDEIYAENCSLRHRSEENRKRCQALEGKIGRLEQQIQEARAESKKIKEHCNEEVEDLEARLAGAIDTIEALKKENVQNKKDYFQLLKDFNERTAHAIWLRDALDSVKHHYDIALKLINEAEQNSKRLKEVNTKLVEELKRVNAQLNE